MAEGIGRVNERVVVDEIPVARVVGRIDVDEVDLAAMRLFEKPERGEVGIYTMDGQGYVKVLGNNELISLNPNYAPIHMTEDIICNGKVIGVLDKHDVEV